MKPTVLKNHIRALKKLFPGLSDVWIQCIAEGGVPTWDATKWVGLLQQKLDKLNFPNLTQKNASAPTDGQGVAYMVKRYQEEVTTGQMKEFKKSAAYNLINARIIEAAWKADIQFLQDFTHVLKSADYAGNCCELYRWMLSYST